MQASKGISGVHVFWIVAGFFALIIGADAYFIFMALNTFPGEQVRNSYVLGLDYNREIEQRSRQAELGWTAAAGIVDGGKTELVLRIADKALAPVADLHVEVSYFVIGGGRNEHRLALKPGEPGEYRAYLDDAHAGRAEFRITAGRGGGGAVLFQASKVMVIP